jgi:hypothetical protein
MTITSPSGYIIDFKDEQELTYGDRRAIQHSMVSSIKVGAEVQNFELTGDVLFKAQEITLGIILKSILRPDGTKVEGDLLQEVMSWKNQTDGDFVFDLVNKAMTPSPKATE